MTYTVYNSRLIEVEAEFELFYFIWSDGNLEWAKHSFVLAHEDIKIIHVSPEISISTQTLSKLWLLNFHLSKSTFTYVILKFVAKYVIPKICTKDIFTIIYF